MRLRSLLAVVCTLLLLLAPIGPARAGNPPPPRTLQTSGIDAHLGYIAQRTCSPAAKPGTSALLKALIAKWGGSSWGISRFCSSGGTSEHKEGRALDWHQDSRKASHRAKVAEMVKWITANNGEVAYRLGVMYIIWNQKIWSLYYSELGWRKMADRGSWTANHKDHVHISLSWDGAMGQTSWWTGKVLTVPKLGACGTKNYGSCLPMIGRSSSSSWPKVPVGPFTPYPSAVPAIGGSARVGLTLRAVAGTWPPAGAALGYQWLRDGRVIAGATGQQYVVAAADLGHALKVRVSATLGGTVVTKTSDGTTDTVRGVFAGTRPLVGGSFVVGSTLTGAAPANLPPNTSVSYQWQRDGTNISGATTPNLALTAADVGRDVRLRVRLVAAGFTSAYRYSAAKEVVPLQFNSAPQPTLSGILRVGGALTVSEGSWEPAATFSYRWYRSGKQVAGQTRPTYTLTAADLGKQISVRVRGSRTGYQSLNRHSTRSAAVQAGLTTVVPKLSDATPRVGQVLTVTPGDWKPAGVAFSNRWYRNGTAIDGAGEATYAVTAADRGATLQVRVTGSLAGYPDAGRRSTASSKVAA